MTAGDGVVWRPCESVEGKGLAGVTDIRLGQPEDSASDSGATGETTRTGPFLLDSFGRRPNNPRVQRPCIIFNPTARGEKARRFRRHLDAIAGEAEFKLTTAPGEARRLAAEAVREGFRTIVAAGGDGTVNEVLNGIGDTPEGFDRARLGVLPLGTVNVFARELCIPVRMQSAWENIRRGIETRIDLPRVVFRSGEHEQARYFAQLAGAGLDARAIELVQWELKKRIGPLAYVLAGLRAAMRVPARVNAADAEAHSATGGLVLIGNGRLYGGNFRIFPEADLRDGLLEVCVFPRVDWWTLIRCGPPLLLRGRVPPTLVRSFRAGSVTLSAPEPVPVEVDGEWVGHLPATFAIERSRLRVVAGQG